MEVISSRSAYSVRNGWIFSRRYDFIYLYMPFLMGAILLVYGQFIDLNSVFVFDRSSVILLFALAAFLDTGHILSTIIQVYFDQKERKRYGRVLVIAPVVIFLLNLAIYLLMGMQYFLYFFAYFNFYHLMRQQYGWMSISSRKSGFYNKTDFLLDKVCIYAAMIIPFIWIHLNILTTPRNNLAKGLGQLFYLAEPVRYLFIVLGIFILLKHLTSLLLFGSINLNKLFIILSTYMAWGAIIFIKSPFALFITSIMHSIPYIALIFFYGESKKRTGQQSHFLFAHRYAFIIFPLVILLCGFLYTRLLRFVGDLGEKRPFGAFEVVTILFSVAFFLHYYLDGFIWKKRNFRPESL